MNWMIRLGVDIYYMEDHDEPYDMNKAIYSYSYNMTLMIMVK